jgi:hypothetical protein
MQTIKQNLQYIQRSIVQETHFEQSAILDLMLLETVLAIRQHTFKYEAKYSSDINNSHFKIYIQRSRKAKYCLLADLEELTGELGKKNLNSKRCTAIIEKVLQNDLYQNDVKLVINRFRNTTQSSTKIKKLNVK